jgi:hypothetical protein
MVVSAQPAVPSMFAEGSPRSSECTSPLTPPQVGASLGTVENRIQSRVFRRGENIPVLLTLRAGPRGVYLPDFFGAFLQTCRYGFSASLLTHEGIAADPKPIGCAVAGPPQPVKFVELKAGEYRTWSTELPTSSIPPGHYCLATEYLNSEISFDLYPNFPRDKVGLLARGHITATSAAVEIR